MVVAIKLETRYVMGLTRYMKIQNLGSVDGPARTPQNAYIMMKMRVATAAAMALYWMFRVPKTKKTQKQKRM